MLARQQNPQVPQSQASPQNLDQIKSMVQTVKNAGNPEFVIAQMMSQNPSLRQVADYANSNGGTYKAAFMKLAQERGIDPMAVMKMLSG